MLIFNELDQRGFVSKGFQVIPPSLTSASDQTLLEHRQARQRFLHALNPDLRVQISWTVNSDYRRELAFYKAETDRLNSLPWPRHIRDEKHSIAYELMRDRQLRRVLPRIYLSKKIQTPKDVGFNREQTRARYEQMLAQMSGDFKHWQHMIELCFGSLNSSIRPMSDLDHYHHLSNWFNPSYAAMENPPGDEMFNPNLTIQQNCWHSAVQGLEPKNDKGFYYDSHYHNIIALKKLPGRLLPNTYHHLTNLSFLDYSITLNIVPLDRDKVMAAEEDAIEQLKGHIGDKNRRRDVDTMEQKNDRISAINRGDIFPFECEFLIHIWDASAEQLREKSLSIKDSVRSMEQAQPWDVTLPTTSLNLWQNSFPGWGWSNYNGYRLTVESDALADLLPIEGSFVGCTDKPEFIEIGENGSLIGWNNFRGGQPQHATMFGKSGSGKSAFMTDLLSQTDPYYDYTVLIEEGLSYYHYTRMFGEKPIIIHPDSPHTINYFDTGGLPLTSLHLSVARSVVAQMMGVSPDQDKQQHREAVLAHYIEQLYNDKFEGWSQRNPKELHRIARIAVALPRYRDTLEDADLSFAELYALFNIDKEDPAKEAFAILNAVTPSEVTRALHDPVLEKDIRNLSFATYTPEQFPRHGQLFELMRDMPDPNHNREEITHIADRLGPWCSGGPYGSMFDGVTNISLTKRLVHFELGKVPNAVIEMKTVTAFLVLNLVRQHIITMPRRARKRMVFEEVGRLLGVPGGDKLVSESYAQMRKFNTWIISIIQQYEAFKDTVVRPFIMGNSSQFYFLRQDDLEDVRSQAGDINGFPESLAHEITRFPMPNELPKDARYSAVAFFQSAASRPVCGVAHIYASPDLLIVAETNHDDPEVKLRISELIKKFAQPSLN